MFDVKSKRQATTFEMCVLLCAWCVWRQEEPEVEVGAAARNASITSRNVVSMFLMFLCCWLFLCNSPFRFVSVNVHLPSSFSPHFAFMFALCCFYFCVLLGLCLAYKEMWQVLCLKPVIQLTIVMLTCKAAFAASDSITSLKLIEKVSARFSWR